MSDSSLVLNDFTVLTTVPVKALAQPLIDFLAANEIYAFSIEDDTKLDAGKVVEVRVPTTDEPRAQELLKAFWAKNEGKRNQM